MSKLQISERPLIGLFGSESAYLVFMYLENYDKGYASQIAKTFGISPCVRIVVASMAGPQLHQGDFAA